LNHPREKTLFPQPLTRFPRFAFPAENRKTRGSASAQGTQHRSFRPQSRENPRNARKLPADGGLETVERIEPNLWKSLQSFK
jgi:hypothetical protein